MNEQKLAALTRWSLALHESAHAVIGNTFGITPTRVALPAWGGITLYAAGAMRKAAPDAKAIVAAAGDIAATQYRRKLAHPPMPGRPAIVGPATKPANTLTDEVHATRDRVPWVMDRAAWLVERNLDCIVQLARELFARSELNAKQLKAMLPAPPERLLPFSPAVERLYAMVRGWDAQQAPPTPRSTAGNVTCPARSWSTS